MSQKRTFIYRIINERIKIFFIHEKQSNTRRYSWPKGLLIDPYVDRQDSEISSKSSTARKRVTFSELPNETYAWGKDRISLRSYDEFPPPVFLNTLDQIVQFFI